MLLSVRQVVKKFPVQRGLFGNPTAFIRAVDGVSFDLKEGQIVGIVGESGCGKSTLGRCVVGLYEPSEGSIFWEGEEVFEMSVEKRRMTQPGFQMVFQNPFASLNPRQKVEDLLAESLEIHGLMESRTRKEIAAELMVKVGMATDDIGKYPHEFSGGQRQRIGLARALAGQPRLIVLDEPVSSLDVSVQAAILNLLGQLNRDRKISYLFISHDLQVVGYLSEKVFVMYLGRIVEEGSVEQVLRSPRHPYAKALLATSRGTKIAVQGDPPSPVQVPSGCAFHPRCPFAEKRCREETQVLREIGKSWKVACWKSDTL